MEVKFIDGCMSYNAYVDNKDIEEDMSKEERHEAMKKIFDHILKLDDPNLFKQIIDEWFYEEPNLDSVDGYTCEGCGDYVETRIKNL